MLSDNERPEFAVCPLTVGVYIGRNEQRAVAMWPIPVVTDNVDTFVEPRLTKGQAPGSWFLPGVHNIEYRAEDTAYNEAFPCTFTVMVRGR